MSMLLLGVSLQPRWPLEDGTAVLRAASHAEDLGFDHVAVGNRLLDSGSGLDADPLVLLAAVAAATGRLSLLTSVLVAPYPSPSTEHWPTRGVYAGHVAIGTWIAGTPGAPKAPHSRNPTTPHASTGTSRPFASPLNTSSPPKCSA